MNRVLIVEDNKAVLAIYKAAFEQAGFDVITAEDGESGFQKATTAKLDVIVTGILMPKLNGFALIEALKSADIAASIPIVVVSNMSRSDDMERALKLGAAVYLDKHKTTKADVVNSVNAVLSNRPVASNPVNVTKIFSQDEKRFRLSLLKLLFIGLAVLAVIATQQIDSFSFYMFVRWAMFVGFISSFYLIVINGDDYTWIALVSIIGAIIFNPFSILTNTKDWWVNVDLITAAYFSVLTYFAQKEIKDVGK